jgi:hypothetical protein
MNRTYDTVGKPNLGRRRLQRGGADGSIWRSPASEPDFRRRGGGLMDPYCSLKREPDLGVKKVSLEE